MLQIEFACKLYDYSAVMNNGEITAQAGAELCKDQFRFNYTLGVSCVGCELAYGQVGI